MPFNITSRDIKELNCDAIVCPSGSAEKCHTGKAIIKPLPSSDVKYTIYTAIPKQVGLLGRGRKLLRSCYAEAVALAVQNGCSSVALPLFCTELYSIENILHDATEAISPYLERYDIDIYVCIPAQKAQDFRSEQYINVKNYIDACYGNTAAIRSFKSRSSSDMQVCRRSVVMYSLRASADNVAPGLSDMLDAMDKGFADTLFYYIDEKGITDVEAYKRSNVSRKTFSKIKCNKDYRPSKITVISFAIGLHLDIEQAQHLLRTAGMCLSRSNKFDVIIEYFLVSGNYKTVFEVNEVLYQFDQSLLGA